MHIGIPKEIKDHEYRVAATPAGVAALVGEGHRVSVETGAGAAIGFPDAAYEAAGAALTDAQGAYQAELIFKVKEPQIEEVARLHEGQWLFCYLHLAAAPRLAEDLLQAGVNALAFETVLDGAGRTPLLAPMSQIAGRLAIQAGMQALEMKHGGRGVLLSGVPGVAPGKVTILGGGVVGANAARMAIGIVVLFGAIAAVSVSLLVVPAAYSLLARRTGSPGDVARKLEAETEALAHPAE